MKKKIFIILVLCLGLLQPIYSMKKENTIILFYILKQTQFSTQVSPDFIQKCTPFSTYYQDENQLPKKMVAILEIKNN